MSKKITQSRSKKITLELLSLAALLFMSASTLCAQQINADHSVTFTLKAPQAHQVEVQGDCIANQSAKMELNKDSVWTFTTPVLPSEFYSYTFLVDGVSTLDPNNTYVIRDVMNVSNVFMISGGQADNYQVHDVPHGTVSRRWYKSPKLSTTRRITIYTPPAYENNTQSYPVLYLLHGSGGDEDAWMQLGRVSQILDNLIAQGKAQPMIVVMPNGHTSNDAAAGESSRGFYSPTFDIPDEFTGIMESTFSDIIHFVENNYRVKKDKKDRAIAGLSLGGMHSLYIPINNPNEFDYVGLFSPAVYPLSPNHNPNIAQHGIVDTTVYQGLNSKLETFQNNGYKTYWIGIGKDDFLHAQVVGLRKEMDSLGMKYTYYESTGGHCWRNWRIYLTQFVPLLFQK